MDKYIGIIYKSVQLNIKLFPLLTTTNTMYNVYKM